MTDNNKKEPGIIQSSLTLFLITALAALALALVYNSTKEKIRLTENKKKTDSYEILFPGHLFGEEKTEAGLRFVEVNDSRNKPVGTIIFAEAKGYSSILQVAYGIDQENKLIGLTVISQQETPGLGARCEEVKTDETLLSVIKNLFVQEAASTGQPSPWFQEQYKGLSHNELWLKSENEHGKITSITGATITSDAITKAVRESLEIFLNIHKKQN